MLISLQGDFWNQNNYETVQPQRLTNRSGVCRRFEPVPMAVGALALGAVALGALAVGYVAIRRLAVGRSHFGQLEIDQLTVQRLRVAELVITDTLRTPGDSETQGPVR